MWKPGLNGIQRVPYHLPEVIRTKEVYIVEGERDVESLRAIGLVATTGGGATTWDDNWRKYFKDKIVHVLPDQDEPGLKLAERIKYSLLPVVRSLDVLHVKGKDISDHLDAGYTIADLRSEVSEDAAFNPIDWDEYESPDVEWLFEPYIPTRGRVLVYGKAGSLKSLWVMWIAAKLAQAGHKVAYFSLEMRPEQSVARLKKFRPPKSHFKLYTSYSMGDPTHKRKTIEALKGYDMIVIDSWNSAYRFMRGAQDDQVAALDTEFFQPIIDGTGATLVILDNTGHDAIDDQGHFVEQQHARGTSAKQDKMDICIWLRRPVQANNYLTEVNVTKMRYDLPIPSKELVVAPSDHDGIEFWYAQPDGQPEVEAWPWEGAEQNPPAPELSAQEAPSGGLLPELSPDDKLAMIMAERIFKGENGESELPS